VHPKRYRIKSIEGPLLQTEGSYSGAYVLAVNFSACNKWNGREHDRDRSICSFCDADFSPGERLTAAEILARLEALVSEESNPRRVLLTGGEPSLQVDAELATVLVNARYQLHLETNGSRDLDDNLMAMFTHVTMSPKQLLRDTALRYCDDLILLWPMGIAGFNPDAFHVFPATQRYLMPIASPEFPEALTGAMSEVYKRPDWRITFRRASTR
jgi:7-carboxy-7-deazaguanine synthase